MTRHDEPAEGDVAGVAEVLAAHRFDWNRLACCATVPLADRHDIGAWHRTHVAQAILTSDALRDLLAAAEQRGRVAGWDEAVQAVAWASDHGPDPLGYVGRNNPYRATERAQ